MSRDVPALPANRAFVVQFRAHSTGALPSWEGRVEHLVTGQVTRFHSLEELVAFMSRVLTDAQEQPGLP
ncbi:MAG: hypothetical protein ACRERE_45575 [Candidatus Entotheonellia bacterium]